MPERGLEPPRPKGHTLLKRACLPISALWLIFIRARLSRQTRSDQFRHPGLFVYCSDRGPPSLKITSKLTASQLNVRFGRAAKFLNSFSIRLVLVNKFCCAPERTRTSNRQIRNLVFYPIELQAQRISFNFLLWLQRRLHLLNALYIPVSPCEATY